ncbi:MAG TPA: serine hydrolase [Gemmatimonadaceae bacterium]|nr:serine hydrolase [Gemmatimonadaceae bacterium]
MRLPSRRARHVLPAFLTIATVPLARVQQPAAPQPAAVRSFPPDSVVYAMIRQRVEEQRSAGIVVGLLEPDGHTRVIAYGDPGPGQPPLDANSVFEIGSITKTFTATVLAELVQEGKVSLDDPVQKYLPPSVHVPMRSGKQITLGNLTEQNSGLPRMPDNFHPKDSANPYADYDAAQMFEFLSHYQLTRDPGAQFEYSNLGVGLLGYALTRATGQSYEELVRTRIFEPLHMEHTAITLTPWMTQHLALGHDEQGHVVPNWDLGVLAGAGAIRSTTSDMLRYLDANLHPERGPLERAMAFAHERRASAGALGDIGLNWLRTRVVTDTVVWHNGGTGGYRTFIGFDPATRMGVVLMTNTGGTGADDIGMHLLEPLVPLAPKPQPVKQRTAITLPADVLSRYVGTYQLAPNFALVVTLDGDALYAQATGQPKIRIWPESETDFFIKEVDAQISFVRDAQGTVTGLVLHQNGANIPGKKSN